MLATFVIGLREGLEAALIVGIIAAFLRKQGRRDLMRWVFLGVGVAVLICAAVGIALKVITNEMPQQQQEGLETVIGALAVGMVTYMVVWMKRNSRSLKGQLEGLAADAMGGTSGAARAMIAMAFLAVLREGVETVVFLLAVFQSSTNTVSASTGAVIGIAVAIALGYGIYRGGVRINLSKFFRATGLVLAFVAAGIVVNTLRTAHEAGWLNVGQSATVDLSGVVRPNSVQESLLTGMLGIQAHPVLIEVIGWLVYLVPVAVFVAWPPGRSPARCTMAVLVGSVAAVFAVATVVLVAVRPGAPAAPAATDGVLVVSGGGDSVVIATADGRHRLTDPTSVALGGVAATSYSDTEQVATTGDLPGTLALSRVAELNGGSLPIGLNATGVRSVQAQYSTTVSRSVVVEPRTHRVLRYRSTTSVAATVTRPAGGTIALSRPVSQTSTAGVPAASAGAVAAATDDLRDLDRRDTLASLAWLLGALAVVCGLASAALFVTGRRRPAETAPEPVRTLARA